MFVCLVFHYLEYRKSELTKYYVAEYKHFNTV